MILFLFFNCIFSLSPRHFLEEDFLCLPLQKKQKQSEESDLDFIVDEKFMESEEDLMEGVEFCILELYFFEFQDLNNKTQVTPRWEFILEQFQDYPQGTFRSLFQKILNRSDVHLSFQFPYINYQEQNKQSDVSLATYFEYMPKFKEKLENSSHWLSLTSQGVLAMIEASFLYPFLQMTLLSGSIDARAQEFLQREFPSLRLVNLSSVNDWGAFKVAHQYIEENFFDIDLVSDFFGFIYYAQHGGGGFKKLGPIYYTEYGAVEYVSSWSVNKPLCLFTYPSYRARDISFVRGKRKKMRWREYHCYLREGNYIKQLTHEFRVPCLGTVPIDHTYLCIFLISFQEKCVQWQDSYQVLDWNLLLHYWKHFSHDFIRNLLDQLFNDPISLKLRGIQVSRVRCRSDLDVGVKGRLSNRSLQCYFEYFPGLEHQLSLSHHWLDLGAGELLAMMQASFLYPHLQMTAVSVGVDDNFKEFVETFFPRIRVLNEWYENISIENLDPLGDIDIVSDVFGVVHYSEGFDYHKLACLNGNQDVSFLIYPTFSYTCNTKFCFSLDCYLDKILNMKPSCVKKCQILQSQGFVDENEGYILLQLNVDNLSLLSVCSSISA